MYVRVFNAKVDLRGKRKAPGPITQFRIYRQAELRDIVEDKDVNLFRVD